MRKKVSYQNLLKEAIAEFDTSKTVDVKGPMLDPILSWDGGGEIPIYKDAASILERYYFNQDRDHGVEVAESEENQDGTEKKTASETDAEGTGTEQAGTSNAGGIPAAKKERETQIAKEAKEEAEADEEKAEADEEEAEADEEKAEKDEEMNESENLENQVIEKLIAEMEEEDEDEEDMNEMDMTYTGEGPKGEAPKEKKATSSEEDAQGAGTQQAGTGDAEGQVPDRKDMADSFVKPKNFNEADDMDDKDEDEDEDLDVDKKMNEAGAAGHVPPPSMQKKMKGEDQGDDDLYEEAFAIFKEAVEDEDEDENEDKDEE